MTLVVGVTTAANASDPESTNGKPVYLALGDSWAYGQGAADPATGGYAALLAEELEEELDCSPSRSHKKDKRDRDCERLQYVNLARPGSATQPGVTAPIVASEQLPIAIPMLKARNGDKNPVNDVEVVTLHVGGNDVSGPIQAACLGGFNAECVGTWMYEMGTFETDLRAVVGPLREAAGPDTPIVLGTYDNPVATCWLGQTFGSDAVMLGAMLLEGTPDGFPIPLDGVHDVVRRVAADYDASVAESFGTLAPSDFVGGQDCLHMTDSGHDRVADTFEDVIEDAIKNDQEDIDDEDGHHDD